MTNANYGYNSIITRQKQLTDYAKTKGCFMYNGSIDDKNYNRGRYWLRSPSVSYNALFVRESGGIDFDDVTDTIIGVVPALTITIKQ